MRKFLGYLIAAAVVAAAAGLWITQPKTLAAGDLPDHTPDPVNGEVVFAAGGCVSCHARPKAEGEDKLILLGGLELNTPFGTFVAPNISSDPENGIGAWSQAEFVTAMKLGTSPSGQHYYPAFPYSSYTRMTTQDVMDLKAYMDTLPADGTPSEPHRLGFPFNIRLSLGGWKLLFFSDDPVQPVTDDPVIARGQYLVEGPGHCGECHTPRNILGGPDNSRWLAGGPNPDGPGTIPNITPGKLTWIESDIVYYLESGFTPDFDSAGGSMAAVIRNTSQLPPDDRTAIAAYLKSVPALE